VGGLLLLRFVLLGGHAAVPCAPCYHFHGLHAVLSPPVCSWLLSHTHVIVGWVFNITFSLALVYASTWLVRWRCRLADCAGSAGCVVAAIHRKQGSLLVAAQGQQWQGRRLLRLTQSLPLTRCLQVVNIAPEAGGAGVAEVTAYLNGCFMPKACDAVLC